MIVDALAGICRRVCDPTPVVEQLSCLEVSLALSRADQIYLGVPSCDVSNTSAILRWYSRDNIGAIVDTLRYTSTECCGRKFCR